MDKRSIGCGWNFGGIGLCVQIVFLVLKLTGTVDWSWTIVFIPAMCLGVVVGICLILVLIIFIIGILENKAEKKSKKAD